MLFMKPHNFIFSMTGFEHSDIHSAEIVSGSTRIPAFKVCDFLISDFQPSATKRKWDEAMGEDGLVKH